MRQAKGFELDIYGDFCYTYPLGKRPQPFGNVRGQGFGLGI